MIPEATDSFFSFLQLSLLPVVLISAAALLLLTLTNRLGRTVDRARALAAELDNPAAPNRERAKIQLGILVRRCRILRLSVTFASASILFSSLLIFGLSLFLFAGWPLKGMILGLFFAITISLIAAIASFLMDVSVSLKAVEVEVEPHLGPTRRGS